MLLSVARAARRAIPVCAALAACGNPSRLDSTTQGSAAEPADPWAGKPGDKAKPDDDKGRGALDLFDKLKTIAETIKKPGPFEAPEQSANFDEAKAHWAVLELGGGVVERTAYSISPFGTGGTELAKLIQRFRAFAKDDKIAGVMLRVDAIEISLPDATELRAAMHELRAARKPIACHVEDASNATYLVLAACDRIALAPLGQIAITGPAAMPIHVKPLLDKLGIQADFLHVGAYKGAAEPLTRDAPSKGMEETLGAILDRHYLTMVDIIATERKLDLATVKTLIDTALFQADAAKTAKLVDSVVSFEAFRDEVVKQEPWAKVTLNEGESGMLAQMMKLQRFLGAVPPDRPSGKHVAVIYAIGSIVDGDGKGVLGARQEIASHTLVPALHAFAQDDDVKAVVLRIDSGGGSAQASELIWRAVAELKAKKPVIVSMSDVAASGGYYIASGATKIFAHDDTLTGSIGVVGGKLAPGGALAKLGVNTFPMGRGKHATLTASLAPWDADEKRVIQDSMEAVYSVFVKRVADGRGKTVDQVKAIADGRVWTGAKAKELGLVDTIGGLDAALAEASTLGGVDPSTDVEVYPPTPTLRDFLHGFTGVQAPFGLSSALTAELGLLDPRLADAARDLLELAQSFQTTHVQAIAVLPRIR